MCSLAAFAMVNGLRADVRGTRDLLGLPHGASRGPVRADRRSNPMTAVRHPIRPLASQATTSPRKLEYEDSAPAKAIALADVN
jgi:hypothetical protein